MLYKVIAQNQNDFTEKCNVSDNHAIVLNVLA